MKSFTNEIHKGIYCPESFDEMMRVVAEAPEGRNSLVRMWRGQSNADWQLHSAAYRRIAAAKNRAIVEKDIIFYEEILLKHAKHKGFNYLDGHELSDLELLSRLQHHGAATRLVDFTRSALIALWFCISGEPNETGVLAGIHAHFIGGYEGELDKRTYNDVINGLETIQHPMTWEPPLVTPRIAAQHSQFVYSDVCDLPTGSLKLPKEEESRLFIAVTPALKASLKAILSDVFDIRATTIFPDLDGFCLANGPAITPDDMLRW
ncbi:MAG: FRG domain-containing protein [Hymenobacter sp.]|nr:MAG: FRG domain-containing protein [Hymenobacter sp.]